MISYGHQTIEKDDVQAVVDALGSELITQGPRAEEFERRIAEYTGARYAVVVSSGTAALHIAMLAAGVAPGDRVLTSPLTFLASANAALYAGAEPVFADVEPDTGNISPRGCASALQAHSGVKAVVPVHYAGHPARMEEIRSVAEARGAMVIEDACHALGARWKDSEGRWQVVGSCSHSDMAVMSFHPVKSITSAEGGVVTTNDRWLYERLKELRNHGVTRDPERFVYHGGGPWYYEMQYLGFNYRLSELHAALGANQMKKLDRFVSRRREIAAVYDRLFSAHSFVAAPAEKEWARSACHLYPVRVDFKGLGVKKTDFFEEMKRAGVSPQVHYIPVHLQPYYRKCFGFKPGDFPGAEAFYANEVSLPIYPTLTDEEVGTVVEALISTMGYLSASPEGLTA